jgi:tetratricopeptide (TPR) repeat protein
MAQLHRAEYSEALECFRQAGEEHRAIGFHYGLSYWLAGMVRALLEIVEAGGEMPEYLAGYLPMIGDEAWTDVSLAYARKCAEECLAISREASKHDTLFDSQLFLARIDAAEGNTEIALPRLSRMLEEAGNDAQLADVHYRLFKLDRSPKRRDHRAEALLLYRTLVEKEPMTEFHRRIAELTATATEASDAPE